MATIPIPADENFHRIPTHVGTMPVEAKAPIIHYERNSNDAWNLLLYVERNLRRTNVYPAPFARHMDRLLGMVLLTLVEAFECFLKECAAVCVDHVAKYIGDGRLDVFTVKGEAAAAHFDEQSVGRALCEASTWLDCEEITKRFKQLLAKPNEPKKGKFFAFPREAGQDPASLAGKHEIVALIFQLRHTIVHNAGVITRSDATKLRRIAKREIDAPSIFKPRKPDVWYVKLFLDDLVRKLNAEVGNRTAELATELHQTDPAIFDPADKAQELADAFRQEAEVAGIKQQPT